MTKKESQFPSGHSADDGGGAEKTSIQDGGAISLFEPGQNRAQSGQLTLDESTSKALAQIEAAAQNENTRSSYRCAAAYWTAWHRYRFKAPLQVPLSVRAVLRFITDHALRGFDEKTGLAKYDLVDDGVEQALIEAGVKREVGPMSLATLKHRLAAITKAHTLANHSSPTEHRLVRETMRSVTKIYARHRVPLAKPALTLAPLTAVLDTCDQSLIGVRDRAMLLFAWASGGRRRSEVCTARREQLRQAGDDIYLYDLIVSKTNQSGARREDSAKPVVGSAAKALSEWLQRSGIETGPLFRGINRGGTIGSTAISTTAFNEMVKKRAARAGLPMGFSAHSIRSGFVTEAAHAGLSEQAMSMSGHRDRRVFDGYVRPQELLNSPITRLADRGA